MATSASRTWPLATRVARAKQIAHHPRIRVEAPELLLGTRYTLDTVRALNRLYPKARFVWLMGSDILPQLVDWAGWRELFAAIPIAAFARPGWSYAALALGGGSHRRGQPRRAVGRHRQWRAVSATKRGAPG